MTDSNVAHFPDSYWHKTENPSGWEGPSERPGPAVTYKRNGNWQVDRDADGRVCRVSLTKKSGTAEGMWTFEPDMVDGEPAVTVTRYRADTEIGPFIPVDSWWIAEWVRGHVGDQAAAHRGLRRGAGKDGRRRHDHGHGHRACPLRGLAFRRGRRATPVGQVGVDVAEQTGEPVEEASRAGHGWPWSRKARSAGGRPAGSPGRQRGEGCAGCSGSQKGPAE